MLLDKGTYKVLQIVNISLTDKTYIRDLFDKTKFQNDKERFGSNGPSLFNLKFVPILMGHYYIILSDEFFQLTYD